MDRVERRLTPACEIQPYVWVREPVTAIYDPADPYAITWRFDAGASWTFARDLLAQGLHEPAGDRTHGDVLFLPLVGAVEVALSSPNGNLVVLFQAAALEAFLDATTVLVPIGSERIDWDAEMPKLGGTR